jgi:hypothetical protein
VIAKYSSVGLFVLGEETGDFEESLGFGFSMD